MSSRHKLRAAVLGATGAVGQRLVTRLAEHPWFELVALAGSERSAGRKYGEASHWLEERPLPAPFAERPVCLADPDSVRAVAGDIDLVFSALDAASAREIEPQWVGAGKPVYSNASPFRDDSQTPLLVPEVNPEHVQLVAARAARGEGFVVTNPNCSVTGLVLALKPLHEAFGLEAVQVTTMQALSGAGYPGVASLDAIGNVIPWIGGEDEKIEREPKKILGELVGGAIHELPLRVSAQANRVPVVDGHLLSVAVALRDRTSVEHVVDALRGFVAPGAVRDLPSSPEKPLEVDLIERFPQPRLHVGRGGGMTVSVGRIRDCAVLDVRFVVLVHNTVRGAAGGALLNAEWTTASLGRMRTEADDSVGASATAASGAREVAARR